MQVAFRNGQETLVGTVKGDREGEEAARRGAIKPPPSVSGAYSCGEILRNVQNQHQIKKLKKNTAPQLRIKPLVGLRSWGISLSPSVIH